MENNTHFNSLMDDLVHHPLRGRICIYDTEKTDEKFPSMETQVGGTHYTDKAIQPIEYIHANGLDFMEGNIVKYVTRHKDKNGAEDIRKIIHYASLILKYQYGENI